MKLQFTNNYRPRFDQISRILQVLAENGGSKKNTYQLIVERLGIPRNQVENLISMMTGFGLVKPRKMALSELGWMLIKADPYFEKIENIWILHYIVASNPEWVVWYRIINHVFPGLDTYTVDGIVRNFFSDLGQWFSEKTILDKLPKEVRAVLASYTRYTFARLNIIYQDEAGKYLRGNPEPISMQVFLFCMLWYRDQNSPGSSALNMDDICLSERSPGRVLNLPEYVIRALLNDAHAQGLIRLERFANLDQVRIPETITWQTIFQLIHQGGHGH